MISIFSYLINYREEEPEYITRYLHGEQITFKDIMSSRVGYYAGYYQRCNCDGTLIKVGNKSHSVHSFLYADSVKRETLEEQIAKEGSFRGYHPVGKIEWQESDIMPSGRHPILKPIRNIQETPYCFSLVMERDEDKDDTWGADHFVVTFLFADGTATYYQLFVKEYSRAPWLFILNEGYKGTIFERDIERSRCYPQFAIFASQNSIWEGYEKVKDVSPVYGEFRKRRDLYKHSGCILADSITDSRK